MSLDDKQILPKSEEAAIFIDDILVALSCLVRALVNNERSLIFALEFAGCGTLHQCRTAWQVLVHRCVLVQKTAETVHATRLLHRCIPKDG